MTCVTSRILCFLSHASTDRSKKMVMYHEYSQMWRRRICKSMKTCTRKNYVYTDRLHEYVLEETLALAPIWYPFPVNNLKAEISGIVLEQNSFPVHSSPDYKSWTRLATIITPVKNWRQQLHSPQIVAVNGKWVLSNRTSNTSTYQAECSLPDHSKLPAHRRDKKRDDIVLTLRRQWATWKKTKGNRVMTSRIWKKATLKTLRFGHSLNKPCQKLGNAAGISELCCEQYQSYSNMKSIYYGKGLDRQVFGWGSATCM